jgi:uncharacterized protein YuzE
MAMQQQHEPTIEYDREADAVYVQLRDEPYARGEDLDDSRRIDYGADGQPIGIELLNVSLGVNTDKLPAAREISRLLETNDIKVYA